MCTLKREVTALTDQVKKLDGASRQIKELTKAYSILTAKVASLRESVDKAKANIVESSRLRG